MARIIKTNDNLEQETLTSQIQQRSRGSKNLIPWLILLIVLIAGAVFYFHQQKQSKMLQKQISDLKQNPQKATEEETKALLDKVGALIELPNEQPTIATVTDLAPLKDQPFFAHAEIGDKVLIFSQAKKAVLYRPSTNKVIEVAPVNLDSPATNANVNAAKTTTNSNANSTNTNTPTNTNKNTNTSTKTNSNSAK